ncbi:hemolysin family protein [Acetobacter indonesiensis]|uniref:Hemolysin C n=1 Tax=Acetobacter indonesiensis TaxID=104101 RepID=A0A252AVB7_9PROT|nr:hemolysin family protein [Acetobacter indonesiensis]MCG0996236.1 hemolysin family protein [Acetobacter indonesiensis]MCP1230669.1 hemolysin family protein [Acetobacter indonesiensis]OUI94380.1 hemolysin C [Acetobacter indonesiensis]OUI95627.1 hemolysin C [Acetobacter indonesiensis]GAN63768.1 hemolysin/magnesium/cobalt transporter CorC/HlyC [Acetobacter indonesiensis]
MSEYDSTQDPQQPRSGLFSFFNRKKNTPGLRSSIAALVQQAADESEETADGEKPELDRQERALIANILRLRNISADDVMVPRPDIVAMSVAISLDDALAMMRRENHSRMPVYREQLDDIVGMIHVKDLIAYVGTSEAFNLEALLRQPLMVAPQIPVLDLMLQMRQRQTHMALVIDEYGGIDGLVTIEDLIETIVGDISDEHDEPAATLIAERPDGSFDVDARCPVEEFERKIGPILTPSEKEAEIETIGGLVFRMAGHVPTRGEVLTHENGYVFRVLDADARHIRRVRLRKLPNAPETPASSSQNTAQE